MHDRSACKSHAGYFCTRTAGHPAVPPQKLCWGVSTMCCICFWLAILQIADRQSAAGLGMQTCRQQWGAERLLLLCTRTVVHLLSCMLARCHAKMTPAPLLQVFLCYGPLGFWHAADGNQGTADLSPHLMQVL